MGPGGIGVDPNVVRGVARQCQSVQGSLNEQASSLTQQLAQLEGSLQGGAAESFKAQFQKWQSLVHQMSETLNTTSGALNKIADAADAQIAALRQLGQF